MNGLPSTTHSEVSARFLRSLADAAQGVDRSGAPCPVRQPRISGASDETLLALAYPERRVLVTEDKDFGEFVCLRRLPHPCIVRLVGLTVAEKVGAMGDLSELTAPR